MSIINPLHVKFWGLRWIFIVSIDIFNYICYFLKNEVFSVCENYCKQHICIISNERVNTKKEINALHCKSFFDSN